MRRVYLIDLENVQSAGLEGIDQLTEEDSIFIFYSDKADNLKIELVRKIQESPARVDFIKANNGTPNALDFQLISYLYYHLEQDAQYWIVSKDTGYDAAIKMGKRMGLMNIRRAPAIKNAVHFGMRATKIAAYRAARAAEKDAAEELQEETAAEARLEPVTQEAASEDGAEEGRAEESMPEETAEESMEPAETVSEVRDDLETENRFHPDRHKGAVEAAPETAEETIAEEAEREESPEYGFHERPDAVVTALPQGAEEMQAEPLGQAEEQAAEAVFPAAGKMQAEFPEREEERPAESTQQPDLKEASAESDNGKKAESSAENQKTENSVTDENGSRHRPQAAETHRHQKKQSHRVQKKETAKEPEPKEKEPEQPVPYRAALVQILDHDCNVATDPETLNLVEDGLRKCSNKGQFYQFFRRRMGAARGSAFYKSLRGQFDTMKKLMA